MARKLGSVVKNLLLKTHFLRLRYTKVLCEACAAAEETFKYPEHNATYHSYIPVPVAAQSKA
jgi:hypothetical protein